MTSFLTISLDFELHWGRFDKTRLRDYLDYYQETLQVVPAILEMFEHYGVHATWATVGSLMADNEEEWRAYMPTVLPQYKYERYSAYRWFDAQPQIWEEALFAPHLVRQLIDCPGQELGSHTFAHFYTCENGGSAKAFRADLKAAKTIAKSKFGQELKSLVFPRNQINEAALAISKEEGFDTVRTNPQDWYWKHTVDENLIKRLFRTGDTLVSLGQKTSYQAPQRNGEELLGLPASRLLRPFRKGSLFNQKRISRIKEEMEAAAKSGEVYHLWWHPHNFGHYPKENLRCLEDILQNFSVLKDTYGMESRSMGEF